MLMWLLNLGFAGGLAPVQRAANLKFNIVFERVDRSLVFESADRTIVVS